MFQRGYALALLFLSGIVVALEAILVWPQFFPWLVVAANVLVFLSLRTLVRPSSKNWFFWLPPFMFLSAVALYMSLISLDSAANEVLFQILIILVCAWIWEYLKNFSKLANGPDIGDRGRLAPILNWGNSLTLFFSLSAIYGLQYFLSLPTWGLMLSGLAVMAVCLFLDFSIDRFGFRGNILFFIGWIFILAQVSWVLYFLPFDYNVLGLLLTLTYMVLLSLFRFNQQGIIASKRTKILIIFAVVVSTLLFITSRWR